MGFGHPITLPCTKTPTKGNTRGALEDRPTRGRRRMALRAIRRRSARRKPPRREAPARRHGRDVRARRMWARATARGGPGASDNVRQIIGRQRSDTAPRPPRAPGAPATGGRAWAGERPAQFAKTAAANTAGPKSGRASTVVATAKTSRRAVTASGVALLVAGGAAGTYLAVAGSLVGMKADASDPVGPPLAAPVAPSLPASASTPQGTTASPPTVTGGRSQRSGRAGPGPARRPARSRPARPGAGPDRRGAPTMPTMRAPSASPSETASATPSPSVSASSTDEEGPQVTGRHHHKRPDQSRDGR